MSNRNGLIEDCRLAQDILCNTSAIDAEFVDLLSEIEVVTELSRNPVIGSLLTIYFEIVKIISDKGCFKSRILRN